jgi:hypothetical protein
MANKKASGKQSKSTVHRSAESGKFVTKRYADKHPKTTVKETFKRSGTDHTGPRKK